MRSEIFTSLSSIFFLTVISICFSLSSSRTSNFLQRGSYLSVENHDSDVLTSPDNTFTCGFYSVGGNAYCFSIWFTYSKEKTVVWMANYNKPVNGHGSRIYLCRDGAFVVLDVDGSIAWDSKTSSIGAQKAELLDNGNLVLKNSSGKILWQSFDSPTDTLLPHQRFTNDKKLISRLGRGNNYAAGYFSFFFDNDNVLKLMYDGPDTYSSLYWPDVSKDMHQNGRTIYSSSRIAVLDNMGRFSSSDMFKFNAFDLGFGTKRRLTMDYDGNLRLYSLNNETGLWKITWEALVQLCKVYGICGRNGICVYTPKPKCSCPPGYEMADPSNWNKGCKPRFKRTCSRSQQLKFVEIPHMNFFGHDSYMHTNKTLEWCKKKCMEDCHCEALNYRLSGEGKCHLKVALFNGYKSPKLKVSTYLKLPLNIEISEYIVLNGTGLTCSPRGPKPVIEFSSMYAARDKRVRWVYLYSFASVIGAIEMLFMLSGWWLLFRKDGMPDVEEEGYRTLCSQFRKFTYIELKKATKKFEEELGKGAYGVVFKGVLADERVVAVKKLKDAYLIEEVFWAEVSTIGKIYHMNLVRMWGFCSEPRHRLLVYEYVQNQSLDKHLFSGNGLGWKERFKVALGTAKGLAYLHHECLEWVIHCDVKPENILLDGEFEPKISDFGLAKLSQWGSNNFEFSRIRGTKGYMAPEWALNLPITAKVDVYSYGVVILELVKGFRLSNWVVKKGEEHETELTRFIKVVKRKIQGEKAAWIDDAVDTRLNGKFSRIQATKLVEIGISCVEEDRSKRPTMDYVVQALLECEAEVS
ncbi:hypothetical protein REPUB_Repub02eG0267600 [Reevesia pubescens]